jgi:hypothetical protein
VLAPGDSFVLAVVEAVVHAIHPGIIGSQLAFADKEIRYRILWYHEIE